jgi:hypothetical protein
LQIAHVCLISDPSMTAARIALLLVLAVASPAAAQTPGAACTFERHGSVLLFLGISTETVNMTCNGVSSTAHVVRVDLSVPGLSFETSGPPPGTPAVIGEPAVFDQELPTSFLQRTRSQVAFNANLFTNCCCYDVPSSQPAQTHVIGLEISGGRILTGVQATPPPLSQNNNCGLTPAASFPFDHSLLVEGKALRIEKLVAGRQNLRADAAVTGSHVLVWEGANVAPPDASGGFFGPTSRTLAGLSADDQLLWIAAVDDGPGHGVTLRQAAQLMIHLKAVAAINLDGGGSTSLAVEGADGMPRLLNVPKDGATSCTFPTGATKHCERYVGASFGIHARPILPAWR